MSTSVLHPQKITKVVKALYEFNTTENPNELPATRSLNKAINKLFEVAATVDPEGNKHPQQQLYYMLWKGNSVSLDKEVEAGILSQEARMDMTGDPAQYKRDAYEELTKLSRPSDLKWNLDTQSGAAVLSGMFDQVSYHINEGAVPDDIKSALTNVSTGLHSYVISMEDGYSQTAPDNDFTPVAQDLLALANNGEQMYDAHRAVSTFLMDRFEVQGVSTSGMSRTYYGSDVVTTIIKDLIENNGQVRVPVEDVPSNIHMPSLSSLSGLQINLQSDIPTPDSMSRARLSSALQFAKEALNNATFVDYNGDAIEDGKLVEKIKDNFSRGVSALDYAIVTKSSAYNLGFSHRPEKSEPEVTREP